ncbi:MAG: DUF1559 domain-containing protein [Planctomycetaceae bacterium]
MCLDCGGDGRGGNTARSRHTGGAQFAMCDGSCTIHQRKYRSRTLPWLADNQRRRNSRRVLKQRCRDFKLK